MESDKTEEIMAIENPIQDRTPTFRRPTEIEDIPEEVMQKYIFSRLPIPSLFQSRYVSSKWRSLINNRVFPKMHYTHSSHNPSSNPICLVLLDWRLNEVYYILDIETSEKAIKLTRFPDEFEWEMDCFPWEIVGSVNGFNCFRYDHEENFIVFNPVSGNFIKQRCPGHHNHNYGLGWDQKNNQYKVISIHTNGRSRAHQEVGIHTVGTTTWRNIGTIILNSIPWEFSAGVFLKGSLHWIITSRDNPKDLSVTGIWTINVEEESFGQEVPIPPHMKGKTHYEFLHLGVLGGCLMIADSSLEDTVQVWVMKDYGLESSWILEFSIVKPPHYKRLQPLGVLKNGNVILACGINKSVDYNEFSSYDPNTSTHEVLKIEGPPNGFFPCTHVRTLVTVKDVLTMEEI